MKKRGLFERDLKAISDDDIQRIHDASVKLLEEHGIKSDSELIFDAFKKNGAKTDSDKRIVYLSKDMVEAVIKSAPNSFVLHARDREMGILLEQGRIYFGMGGASEPMFWDYSQMSPRDPLKQDMINNTRVGQEAKNIDFVMALCQSGDVPKQNVLLHDYDALLRNTIKPIVYTAPDAFHAEKFIEMAMAACGGEDTYRERPCVMIFVQPTCPMKLTHYFENILVAAKMFTPILLASTGIMGGTSPVTLAGTIVQTNAEILAGITLAELIKPGTPVVYGLHLSVLDMTTGISTYNSPEQVLGRIAGSQLGRFYNLPTWGLGGGVEARMPDAEAASQAMMGLLTNALAGVTCSQALGTLASGLYGSPEMALICDEMVHMIKHVLMGIAIDDETLALNVIKQVGHGGDFLSCDHTAKLFRDEIFFPNLFRRESVEQWMDTRCKSILEVAHERVQDILSKAGPVKLPEGADKALEETLQKAIEQLN